MGMVNPYWDLLQDSKMPSCDFHDIEVQWEDTVTLNNKQSFLINISNTWFATTIWSARPEIMVRYVASIPVATSLLTEASV